MAAYITIIFAKEGVQKRLKQNVLLGRVDYFEVKAIETLQAQKNFPPSLKALKPSLAQNELSLGVRQGKSLIVEAPRAPAHSLVQEVTPPFSCLSPNLLFMWGL